MRLFLTDDELRELTDRQHRPAQVKVLRSMGIEHRVRPDGTPLVLRDHIAQVFAGRAERLAHSEAEPNWDALDTR